MAHVERSSMEEAHMQSAAFERLPDEIIEL
jgi:hypothetical protein